MVCPDPSNPTIYIQVGVVSWGIGCKTVGNPGVYGSIPNTVKWIRETMDKEAGGIIERAQGEKTGKTINKDAGGNNGRVEGVNIG